MGKIKIKKNDVWIDMTPMSDVMVLLLTFFMLSANFVKNEVVKVVTPASQTMAAGCQMVASVSDSEMPTAIENLLAENESFHSGTIW